MEPAFCDLCQHSVPEPELATGRARKQGGKVVCGRCRASLAPAAASPFAPGPAAPGPAAPGPAGGAAARPRGSRALALPLALSCGALLFAVAAATLLLVRIERQADGALEQRARLEAELAELRRRSHGLERIVSRRVREELEGLRGTLWTPGEELRDALALELELAREELALELATGNGDGDGHRDVEREPGGEPAPRDSDRGGGPEPSPSVDPAELEQRLAWLEDQLSDLRLRRDLPRDPPTDTGLPPPPQPGAPPERVAALARLSSEDPALRAGALFALAAAGDRGAVRDVLPLLADPHPYVRETAARLLERLDARPAVQHLIAALEDEEVHVREAAVTALRGITRRSFGFDPRASRPERAAAVAAWRAWWRESWKAFLYGEPAAGG